MDDAVEDAFGFYASYLVGQMAGMSEALDLAAVRAALEIEDVPRDEWPVLTRRYIVIHNEVMKIVRAQSKHKGSGNG